MEIKERRRIGFGFQTFFEQFCVSFTLSLLKVTIAYIAEVTAMVLTVVPSIIVFILLQKHIVEGVVAGAVKG